MNPQSNQNNFFGIKVSQPGINVNNASPSQLVYENNYSAETFFNDGEPAVTLGLQSDGSYGGSISNGQFTFSYNGTEQIIIGTLPDGTVGIVQSILGVDVTTLFS